MHGSRHMFAFLLALLPLFWSAADIRACNGLPRGEVLAPKSGGGFRRLRVEIANTLESRARGLMFRRRLKSGHGMLLRWKAPKRIAIWMKNTYLPLDIIFIARDGRIVRVRERARPLDTTIIPSRTPVIAVLELPAGDARRFGLRPGVRLRLPKSGRCP